MNSKKSNPIHPLTLAFKALEKMDTKTKRPHTQFIILSGKKQSGKDTAANILSKILHECKKNVSITAFAGPLKSMCVNYLKLNEDEVYGSDADKNKPSHIQWENVPIEFRHKYAIQISTPRTGKMTNREVLQVVGTDIFRSIYPEVWTNFIFNNDANELYDVIIVTDCRFPNEKEATERHGGVIIRLERKTGSSDNHPSETALDGFEFENLYHNDGTLEELENYLRNLLKNKGII